MNLRNASLLAAAAMTTAGLFSAAGCELIAVPDRSLIPAGVGGGGVGGSGGTGGTGGEATTGGGMGGLGGAGGAGGQGGQGGTGGTMCTDPGDCPGATECIAATCTGGVCGTEAVAAGTALPPGSQTAGDCKLAVCDGSGTPGSQTDIGDTPDDGLDCTASACVGDMPVNTPVVLGAACNDGGGTVCNDTGDCVECNVTADCMGADTCQLNTCVPASCMDGVLNGNETGLDCGGVDCADCANGLGCEGDDDCMSGFCNPTTMLCAAPTCSDGFENQDETDVDCGGATCPDCANGETCQVDGDCVSGICDPLLFVCLAAPTCSDGIQNQGETDVDCGGANCPDCADGDTCLVDGDCVSGFCHPTILVCAVPTCADGFQNQGETGVDCGGPCATCNGQACTVNSDCASGMCYENLCVAAVNGCNINTAQDLGAGPATVMFANGNFTYAPKCIKVNVNTVVTFNGNFAGPPHQGGQVVGGVLSPNATGPFGTLTNTGSTMAFTMATAGTFPYYCVPHGAGGMNGAVFVVP